MSDLAIQLVYPKKDGLKDETLESLVRICGKSRLYLPSEYAPGPLTLPTCFRATGQYLIQHGEFLTFTFFSCYFILCIRLSFSSLGISNVPP